MSDEEYQFESKADAGASKTYPQQAGTIRKGGYIVIKNRACKVFLLSEDGYLKNDVKLPNNCILMSQMEDGFLMGRELVASVISAMGEEHICAIKDLGMKTRLVSV
ncbi:eukaryotic translation initiation factor 5A-like [Rutidosis leptorrhynchoides]|uniref:eukaryotic translation initiation factor 5A-like n=1 Tax=Rutidosis leptorrhynchoides TaxID=125765 RepID=UPI003A9A1940